MSANSNYSSQAILYKEILQPLTNLESSSQFSAQYIKEKGPRLHSHYNNNNSTSDSIEYKTTTILFIITLIIVSLWITIMNSITIYGIYIKNKKFKTFTNPTDLYFINLAIIDVIDGLIILPFMGSVVIIGYFSFGFIWCQCWIFIDYTLIIGSSIGLMCLVLNYFWIVRRPGEYKQTKGQHVLLIILAWIVTIFIWIPAFIHNYRLQSPNDICGFNINTNHWFTFYVGIFGLYLPLIISIITSIYAVNILKKKVHERLFYVSKLNPTINQNEKNLSTSNNNYGYSNNNNNSTVMMNISPMYLKRIWSRSVIFETNHIFKVHERAKKELPLLLGLLVLFIISRTIFFIYFGVGAFVNSIFPRDLSNSVYWILHLQGCLSPLIHLYFDKEARQAVWNKISNLYSTNNNIERLNSSSIEEIIDWSNKKVPPEMFVRRIEVKSIAAPMIKNVGTNDDRCNNKLAVAVLANNKTHLPIPMKKQKLRSTGHAIFSVIR